MSTARTARTARHFTTALAAFALPICLSLASFAAFAQARTTRIVVGNQPGGATDIVARMIAPKLSAALGQTFIVENRAGASGNIAAEAVARAAPDGQTLLLAFNSHPTMAALFPRLPFDPIKDFASVGLISESPYLVVARADIGVDNLKALFEKSRQTRKPLNMGSPGAATPQHLLMERMKKDEGVDIQVVHFKGTAPALTDLVGGHIDLTLVTPSAAAAFVKSGKLKLLAVTSARRLPDFPNAPTAAELGVGSVASSGVWLALLAPAKTPRPVIERLNRALTEALHSPEAVQELSAVGMSSVGGTPEDLDKRLGDEQRIWTALIRELNIKPE